MTKFLFSIFIFFSFAFFSQTSVFAKGIKIEKKAADKFEIVTEDAKAFLFDHSLLYYDSKKQVFMVGTWKHGEKQIKATPKNAIEVAYITGMLNKFEYDGEYKKVLLVEKDGKFFYEVRGHKTGKIFGLWPVSYDVKATIDEEGKLASFEKPFILKFLKYIIK